MEFSNTFKRMVTGKTYMLNCSLNFNTKNVMYLIIFENWSEQYAGSVINLKDRFSCIRTDIKEVRPFFTRLSII